MANKEAAQAAKALGNTAFGEKDYTEAIKQFTEAINQDPSDHVFFSNRSACHASLENYEKALEDGTECVKLKADWAKGYTRKGLAEYFLKKYDESAETYKSGLKVTPDDGGLAEGLRKAMHRAAGARINYDANYNKKDVVALSESVVAVWKKTLSEAGVDNEKLMETIRRIAAVWRVKGSEEVCDRDFQALLAIISATNGWLDKEKVIEIDALMAEVGEIDENAEEVAGEEWKEEEEEAEEEGWIEAFDNEEALTTAAYDVLHCRKAEVVIDKVGRAITIDYKGGDYGAGKHDGQLVLNDDGLMIYNYKERAKKGKETLYLLYGGESPTEISQISDCIWDENWEEEWEEDAGW